MHFWIDAQINAPTFYYIVKGFFGRFCIFAFLHTAQYKYYNTPIDAAGISINIYIIQNLKIKFKKGIKYDRSVKWCKSS